MLRFLRQRRSDESDEALLARHRAGGDLEALGQLYDRYVELVYGLALKYLGEAAAGDAAMAVFEELVEKTKAHDIKNFRSWLYVLAKNHCLMQLRRQSREATAVYEPELMQFIDSRHLMEDNAGEDDREEALSACLERLNALQKQCIELFYYEGKSYKEIAELLPEEVGKVRSYIQNGRRNLRICIEERMAAKEG